ncbi:MAG: hypothetical protein WD627_11800 [Actinomycetota bacterium]
MGEGDTIVSYPEQADALVAAGRDPVASMANLDELQSLIAPDGWQPSVETPVRELEWLKPSTLLVWGFNDPLGGKMPPTRQPLPFRTPSWRCSTPATLLG